MPVKAPALALAAMAHLCIMHRHDPILAHPIFQAHLAISISLATVPAALHVLEQQLPQQLRCVYYRLSLLTIGAQPGLRPPANSSNRSASATISPSSFRRARRSDQSMPASPFTLEPT